MVHSILIIGQSNMGGRGFIQDVEPIDREKITPPIKETISLSAVNLPRFLSSTSSIHHASLGAFITLVSACPESNKVINTMVFTDFETLKKGTK